MRKFLRNRGCRRQRRARVEQRPKAQPRRCRFAALAVAACGAHAHQSLRRVVLALGWNSRVSLSLLASLETRHRRASRACTVTRAHARERDVPCTAAGSGTRPHVLAKEWRSAVEFRPAHVHVPAQSSSAHGHCPEIRETLAHSCSRARRLWRSRLGSFQREEQQKRQNAC